MDKLAAGFEVPGQQREGFAMEEYSSLPHMLLRCLDMCQAPRVDAEQLATIISMDAVLVGRLFSLADFSKVDTQGSMGLLVQVLEQLGLSAVKTVIKTAALKQVFQAGDSRKLYFLKLHWEHTLYTALSAGFIAQRTGYYNEEEAYLAALMHNIGQIALENKQGANYTNFLFELVEKGPVDMEALETQVFGEYHPQLGSDLIRRWGWSSFVADAVQYHHAPLKAVQDAHELVKIVHFANCMASKNDQLSIKTGQVLFGLSEQELAEIQVMVEEKVSTIAERIDLEYIAGAGGKSALNPLRGQFAQSGKEQVQAVIGEADFKKQALLAAKVFDIGLVDQVSHLFDAATENTLYQSVFKGANVLFGLKQGLLFLYDESGALGKVYSPNKVTGIENLTLPMEEGRSLIANALIRNEITDSFSLPNNFTDSPADFDTAKIVDLQIARFLEKPGIVCLPLVDIQQIGTQKIGVLVFGLDQPYFSHIQQQQNLLYGYLQESAAAIAVYRKKKYQESENFSNELMSYQTKIDSMVHEVNNPLTIVQHYLQLLKQKLPDSVDLDDEIKVLKEELQRAANILSTTREIKTPFIASAGCDVNQVIGSLVGFFDQSLMKPHSIRVMLELDTQVPVLDIDTDKLKQVFSNLLKNAAEELIAFKPNAGKTSEKKSDSSYRKELRVSTRDEIVVNGSHYVEIIVQDNGGGIPDKVMQGLFRPLDSTKGYGHQGLGLSIVRSLMEEMNGFITCKTSADNGTLFQILLPRKQVVSSSLH